MLGSIISKIRKQKHMTKVELSNKTGINIGHLSHIEKGERNPSHKTLKTICEAMDIPYMPISYTYEKELTPEHKRCNMINHISGTKILAIDSFSNFIECPSSVPNSSIALKINDNSMEPYLLKDSYGFLEFNVPLNSRDVGLFIYNNNFLIRRFIVRKDTLILRADNKIYPEIYLTEDDNFTIIGRIVNPDKK